MTERRSRFEGDREFPDTADAVSTFWQECHRYHELAENFTRDVAITHPDGMSGRHEGCPGDTECCGCCSSTVDYYEHIPNSRYSTSVRN